MLSALQNLLSAQGYLSGIVIDEADGLPSSSNYRSQFGTLLRAYSLIGYTPERDYSYIEINRALREQQPNAISAVIQGILDIGGKASPLPNGLLSINDEFTVSIVLARCSRNANLRLRWTIHLDTGLVPDVHVVARMNKSNGEALDYFLLPRIDMTVPKLKLAEANDVSLDCYRFDDLQYLFQLSARSQIMEVA